MADKMNYHVLREHYGDREYMRGDTRELRPDEAAHLVRLGVLSEAAPEGKAKSKPEGKAKAKG